MTPFEKAQSELRELGIKLTYSGAYRVNYVGVRASDEIVVDDLEEAVSIGNMMAKEEPKREMSIGPMGLRSTWRSRMYRHNRKVAARRNKSD
jgi:hypothetical protein